MGYDEYLPPSYTATGAKSPLILFFHGSGESGDGIGRGAVASRERRDPEVHQCRRLADCRGFVVLAPQHLDPGTSISRPVRVRTGAGRAACNSSMTAETSTSYCTTPQEVKAFIDYAVAHYNVDPRRVYLTGLSCGAYGIWEYLAAHGVDNKVAAAVPIAGDGRPGSSADYCALDATPIWAFHGLLDDVVTHSGVSNR